MTEATHLHAELMHALQHLIPKTTYHDPRRLSTLAWAITGLCLSQTVRLSAWAEVAPSRSQSAARRVRRFSRWLHHEAIFPADWYRPVAQAALSGWPQTLRLPVALDTTVLSPFVLICASLLYRGRAIPLAWRALRHASAQVGFADYQPVLDQLDALVPTGQALTLLADRGFAHEALLAYLRQHDYHFRIRLPGDTLVQLPGTQIVPVKTLAPAVGHMCFFQQVHLFGSAWGPVSLALATPEEHADDPWYLASSELTSPATLAEYAQRWGIEASFRDQKSGSFQLQASQLREPEAIERLLLVLALSTLHLTSLGVGVVQANKRDFVDHHRSRRLSYLKVGARWRRQQEQRGWPSFAPFWLDPAPDPFPVLTSRPSLLEESLDSDLPKVA
jgi:hypothetical protein